MKKIKSISILLIAILFCQVSCLKIVIDNTYEIKSISWIDEGLDFDKDDYPTNRTLECMLFLLEPVSRDIEIRIYYRLSDTRDYIFYASIDEEGFMGGTDTPINIQIGLTRELSHGNYDFLIEIYEKDNDRVEASGTIENAPFERLASDQNYDLSAWWSDYDDYDYDNYPRSAFLNIDVDISLSIAKEVKAEVLYQKVGSDEDYISYFKSDYYTINGDNNDTLSVPTGFYPDTLGHGLYNFKIVIMERNIFSPVLIYVGEQTSSLKEIPFENDLEDGYLYSLNTESLGWTVIIDNDGDGYAQNKVLLLDVDIDKDETVEVIAKIFRKQVDEENYIVLDSTDIFTVTGSGPGDLVYLPVHSTLVTDSVKMPHGEYDFMISVFEILPNTEYDLRFSSDSIDGTILKTQKFELSSEDI